MARRSARQIAAQRKAALASARKRRRGRAVTKARSRKMKYQAKNRKKFTRRSYVKRDLAPYKNTGLAMIKANPNRSWRGVNKSLRKGGKHNIRHKRKLDRHNKRINRAIARNR